MAITEEEKVAIRDHMGYPNVTQVATFALGTPAAFETTFMIEGAMVRVAPSAEGLLRKWLQVLNAIDAQRTSTLEDLEVLKIGDIEINPRNQALLRAQYDEYVDRLSTLLGVPRNPFDKRLNGGGLNVSVIG